jgi:hypothetical protein
LRTFSISRKGGEEFSYRSSPFQPVTKCFRTDKRLSGYDKVLQHACQKSEYKLRYLGQMLIIQYLKDVINFLSDDIFKKRRVQYFLL